jgi:gliding motility-associated-like protein
MSRRLLIFLFICFTSISIGQEICNNGIDDDGDGFIDLNDQDCACTNLLPSSLIPNPSFEERTCCPTSNARLDCAVGWIQASNPTTDYVHTCGGYLGNTNIPAFAPLPFPDGEGAVGFRDGQNFVGSNYKEYVGACLTEAMQVGVGYRLHFYVGFRDNIPGNKSLDIAIFGSDNCQNLPFGNNSNTIGCPANTSFYDEIEVRSVSGSNEWVEVTFDFIPAKSYEVIIIGPACAPNPNYIYDPYFYLDGITLAEASLFGIPIDNITGSLCVDQLILSITDKPGQTYQWYKDGIALTGEENAQLSLVDAPDVGGDYQVVIQLDDGCIASRTYSVRVPPYFSEQEATICENEEYFIENNAFTQEGIHEIIIPAEDGCDSIITLTLHVNPNTTAYFEAMFCEGDSFQFLDIHTDQPGIYQTTLSNSMGCDSIITLELSEIRRTEGIDLPGEVSLTLGDEISITPDGYDPELIDFTWYNAVGDSIGNASTLNNFRPVDDTYLTLVGKDMFGCSAEDQILLKVDRSTITLHLPNIFTPDNNQVNDFFSFIPTKAVQSIESFEVYDRWGNQLFIDAPFEHIHDYLGWDGTYQGQKVAQGVYGYLIKATFIDGSKQQFSGNLTLIRFQ